MHNPLEADRPLLNSKSPNFVWVADKPIGLGGIPKKIPIEELEKKCNFKYCEDIFLSNQVPVDQKFGHKSEDRQIWEKINARLNNPLNDNLVLCFIDDKVGYGVFANEIIEAGTIIGIYAGYVEDRTIEDAAQKAVNNDYNMSLINSKFRINASKCGGITRFIQHLPFSIKEMIRTIRESDVHSLLKILEGHSTYFTNHQVKELTKCDQRELMYTKNLNISALEQTITNNGLLGELEENELLETNSDLATANIRSFKLEYNQKLILYLQACRKIEKGEQLGISYTSGYWVRKGEIPRYFYKNGEMVPKNLYISSLDSLLKKYIPNDTKKPIGIEKNYALRTAVFNGFLYDAKLLLFEYGALIDDQTEDAFGHQRTPLHLAIHGYTGAIANGDENRKEGCRKAIKLLLDRNANRNIKDKFGRTALHYAVMNDLQDIAELLCQYGVEVEWKDIDGYKAFDYNISMFEEIFQSFKELRSKLLSSYQYTKVLRGEVKYWIQGEIESLAGLYAEEANISKFIIFFGKKNNKYAILMLNYNDQNNLKVISSIKTLIDVITGCVVCCPKSQKDELGDLYEELKKHNIDYQLKFTEKSVAVVTASYRFIEGVLRPKYLEFFDDAIEDFYGELIDNPKEREKINDLLPKNIIVSDINCYWCTDTKNNTLSIGFDNLAKSLTDLGGVKEKYPQKEINLFNTKIEAEKHLREKFKSKSSSNCHVQKAFVFELSVTIDNCIEFVNKKTFEDLGKQVACIYEYSRDEKGDMKLLNTSPKLNPMLAQEKQTTIPKAIN